MFMTFRLLLVLFRRFQGFVKLLHGLGFVGRGNVYVGFHGLVVAVAGPRMTITGGMPMDKA